MVCRAYVYATSVTLNPLISQIADSKLSGTLDNIEFHFLREIIVYYDF